jgi:hypothetical protein
MTSVCHTELRRFMHRHEAAPQSRWRFGSPCRFVRSIDIAVHIVLPAYLAPHLPAVAAYLRRTSPRWGRAWRHW